MKGLNYAVAMLGVAVCFATGLLLSAQLAYAEMDRQDLEQAVQREAEKLAKENPELAREFVKEYKEYTREAPGYEHEKEIVAIKADQRGISDTKMAAGKPRIVEKPDIAAIHLNAVDKLAIRDDMRAGAIKLSAMAENPKSDGEGPKVDGPVVKEPGGEAITSPKEVTPGSGNGTEPIAPGKGPGSKK